MRRDEAANPPPPRNGLRDAHQENRLILSSRELIERHVILQGQRGRCRIAVRIYSRTVRSRVRGPNTWDPSLFTTITLLNFAWASRFWPSFCWSELTLLMAFQQRPFWVMTVPNATQFLNYSDFFYLYLIIHLIYFFKKIIIYFINKENSNINYNFTYLNKYFK
jgi:hypothetical protein